MSIIKHPDGAVTFVGPKATNFYRLISLRVLLRFEIGGLRNRSDPFPAVEQALAGRLPEGKPPRRRSDRARLYLPLLSALIDDLREELTIEASEGGGQ